MQDFRAFYSAWLRRTGRTFADVERDTGISTAVQSRWFPRNGRPGMRPSVENLKRLAPLVGHSQIELMQMAGWIDTDTPLGSIELDQEDRDWLTLLRSIPESMRETARTVMHAFTVAPAADAANRRLDPSANRQARTRRRRIELPEDGPGGPLSARSRAFSLLPNQP